MKCKLVPTNIVIHALLALEYIHSVSALVNGTAQCISGMPDYDDPNGSYINGSLSSGAIVFTMNGIDLSPGLNYEFPEKQDLEWSVETFRNPFIGFLVRFEADASNFIDRKSTRLNYSHVD